MKRKRDDSVKPGKGINGTLGENYSRAYAVDPWSYPGEKSKESVYEPAYSPASDGASAQRTSADDFQFTAATRQIWQDVEENQNPGGEFDTTGPIKAGVNRKQDE
jgi:hypothetical protein